MRKLFALLAVAGTFAFVSCEKKSETSATDSTATTVIEAPADTTTMAPADSSATPVDTTVTK